ncbi:hypothetical protein K443DRAFT_7714 [Laccaria amethystina LaAM-08-1]|uniref:Uncharacterized protein n=1 Tax=Laccaria amethystina LaAM-08-1 TaxID=1095629 RepID=A0A0C9X5P5_9AGAR|nr:hypothetical protein K443DRAFT_7714 [Laccaria amethystina LaAM-08-1]
MTPWTQPHGSGHQMDLSPPGAQQCFNNGNQALLALSTSSKIDEYCVLSTN